LRVKLLTFGLVIPVCAATLLLMTAAKPEAAVHAAPAQAAAKAAKPAASPATEYGYKVVKSYAHDRRSFTQGFEFRAGVIYESTGREGMSWIRRWKLDTGEVLQQVDLSPQYFGEGITVLNQRITQLTYKTETGFVYDQTSFKQLRQFHYPGEGWGLTNDGQRIFMSDGSAQIRVWDANTLKETGRITVRDGAKEVEALNELEYIRGEIWANIWLTDKIVRFSPKDGRVTGWIDLAGILTPAERTGADVLNGIAFDSIGDRIFVTGKLWPKVFEIKLVPKTSGK
jgi:glutaminyl-peptide cyclotransferase